VLDAVQNNFATFLRFLACNSRRLREKCRLRSSENLT